MALLEVRNLRVRFDRPPGEGPPLQAVDEVSLRLEPGETLGLVGESGSGKSVTALAILGLLPAGAVVETGEVRLAGRDLLTLPEAELRRVRGNEVAMVFQDPLSSLNPLLTVGLQLAEVLETHRGLGRREALLQCARALGEVGLPRPEALLAAYPHELSGGMRQRALIAMALLCRPKVLLADEPTTALDVTVQAQVLALLRDLQERHGTAILLISHDLGVVAGTCARVHVMYAGRVVESAEVEQLFAAPLHPYTLGLLRSVPTLLAPAEVPAPIPGQPPSLAELPKGCAFQPRCAFAVERCARERPAFAPWRAVEEEALRAAKLLFVGGRRAACFESRRVVEAGARDRPSPEAEFDWRVPPGGRG